jgi:protein O-GlcNAc transferase
MMMEIISFTLSIDVLRITINPRTGLPYFTDHDIPHSQVVFIDNFAEGPLWDLYGIATGIPPVRLSHLTMHEPTTIVTPLPGASNPFWHGHWNGIDCGESILMRTFARRVLAFHNLTAASPAWREAEPFRLTILNRTRTRRLLHLADYVAALRDRHPDVAITVVDDAATLPFAQQLRIAHSSDILVGAHGAGLTHGMFLRPGSTLVELLPHGLPNFQGFRNVAHFMGLRYLDGHGVEYEAAEKTGDWYRDDVFMEKDRFLELMDLAIGKWST